MPKSSPHLPPQSVLSNERGVSRQSGIANGAQSAFAPTPDTIQRAKQEPGTLSKHEVLSLQRTIGNRAVGNLVRDQRGQVPGALPRPTTSPESEQPIIQRTSERQSPPTIQRAPSSLIQRWFGKKKTKTGTSFDNPKHYSDPKMLKKHRGTQYYAKARTYLYDVDPDTGRVSDDPRDKPLDSDYPIGKKLKPKTRQFGRTQEEGYTFEGVWVYKNDVKEATGEHVETDDELHPTTGFFLEQDDEGEWQDRIERRMPTIDDIRQAGIGDCWLEAALISIVSNTPEYIHDMMRDNGDTVTVRLYEVNRRDPKKPTFKPRYISVNKSTAKIGGNVYQHGALWVSMVQKAYVAGGFTGSGKRKTVTSKSPGIYKNIDGGHTDRAFEVLLGTPSERIDVSSGKAQNKPDMKELPWSTAEVTKYLWASTVGQNYDGLVSSEIFNGDVNKIKAWMKWVRKPANGIAINNLFSQRRKLALIGVEQGSKILGKRVGYQAEVRLENLQELFQTRGLDPQLIPELTQYLKRFFPGKRGMAKYTKEQMAVYTKIKDALESGRNVAAGTQGVVGRTSDGIGHSGGEEKAKGLVGGHAYSILGVEDEMGSYYVIIQNPWGTYGRDYDMNDDGSYRTMTKQDDGQSKLHLSDFTKRFNLLYLSDKPIGTPQNNQGVQQTQI